MKDNMETKYSYEIWEDEDYDSPDQWEDEGKFILAEHRDFTVKAKYSGCDIDEVQEYLTLKRTFSMFEGDDYEFSFNEYLKDKLRAYNEIHEIDFTEEDLDNECENHHVNRDIIQDEWDYRQWKDKYDHYEIFPLIAYIHSGISLSISRGYPFDCQWDSGQIGYVLIDKNDNWGDKSLEKVALDLIEEWNQYLSGDVWGYSIYEETTCDKCNHIHKRLVDICGGFYGRDYTEEIVLDTLKRYKEKAQEYLENLKPISPVEKLFKEFIDNLQEKSSQINDDLSYYAGLEDMYNYLKFQKDAQI